MTVPLPPGTTASISSRTCFFLRLPCPIYSIVVMVKGCCGEGEGWGHEEEGGPEELEGCVLLRCYNEEEEGNRKKRCVAAVVG